jgi:hypothetical protein
MRVFLSYSHDDREAAESLEAALRAREIDCWVDRRNLKAGHSYPNDIDEAVRRCDALVFLVSARSVASDYVRFEVTAALTAGTPVMPVMLERINLLSTLPAPLNHKLGALQSCDYQAGSSVTDLINDLKTLAGTRTRGRKVLTGVTLALVMIVVLGIVVALCWRSIVGRSGLFVARPTVSTPDSAASSGPAAVAATPSAPDSSLLGARSFEVPTLLKPLPAGEVLKIIYGSLPPADPAIPPSQPIQVAVEILARRAGTEDGFAPIADGDSLCSEKDDYKLVVRPKAAGFLYLFQIDSMGTVTWLFPRNPNWKRSHGLNPVRAGDVVSVPASEGRALFLDATLGVEHVYAVISPTAWPKLADALGRAAGIAPGPVPAQAGGEGFMQGLIQAPNRLGGYAEGDGGGGASSDVAATPPSRLPYSNSDSRAPAGERATANASTAASHVVVERWFKHVAPATADR